MFYAIHAKNEYGYSYFSNDEIAKRLGVSKKTISNWVKTLLDAGLIARKAQLNSEEAINKFKNSYQEEKLY
ncbi:helix-turn-helix domain-containing protein [Limosilactobacillus reuteri]|nr:helix-turn-helix domain-containing protein [Limosilactobacillus reuteri]QIZ03606.1 helix-turn-helix domain-containing protein [Limosilactobacillus reuteri]